MKLIVGLGNPGDKFKNTKHNIGYEAIDYFAMQNNISFEKKHNSLFYKTKNFILLKPLSFMNNSGQVVQEVVNFYKIKLEDILVIHDDVTLDFGKIRTKPSSSHGGQNGVKDIILKLGTNKFWRTKLGVGYNQKYDLSNWVLSKFKIKEQEIKQELIENSNKIIELFINNKTLEIMNKFN